MNKLNSKSLAVSFFMIALTGCSTNGGQSAFKSAGATIDDASRKMDNFYSQGKKPSAKGNDAKSKSTGIGFRLPLDCSEELLLKCHRAKGPVQTIREWSGKVVDGKAQFVPMPQKGVRYAEFDRDGYLVERDLYGSGELRHYTWDSGLLIKKEEAYSTMKYYYDSDGNEALKEHYGSNGELYSTFKTRYSLDGEYVSVTFQSRRVKPDPRRMTDMNFGDAVTKYDREGHNRFWRGLTPMLSIPTGQTYTVPSEKKYETMLIEDGNLREESELTLDRGEWVVTQRTWHDTTRDVAVEEIYQDFDGKYPRVKMDYDFDARGNWKVSRKYKGNYTGNDEKGNSKYEWKLSEVTQRDIAYYE